MLDSVLIFGCHHNHSSELIEGIFTAPSVNSLSDLSVYIFINAF